MELDGFECADTVDIGGLKVPLVVEGTGKPVAVGVRPGLVDPQVTAHSLSHLEARTDVTTSILNSYVLKRNLPDMHQAIRASL